MSYEELKRAYCSRHRLPHNTKLGSITYLTMAAASKVVAVATTYPYQVVRARLQDQESKFEGALDTICRTYRYEGIRAFYKGLVPNIIKVTPSVCITFVVYEHLSHYLLGKS